jgi:hypothetical protein
MDSSWSLSFNAYQSMVNVIGIDTGAAPAAPIV